MFSEMFLEITGRLTEDATIYPNKNNPNRELLVMTVAVDVRGYKDKTTQQFKKSTEFLKLMFNIPKGGVDYWVRDNKMVKGHQLTIRNLILIQGASLYNGKAYPDNYLTMADGARLSDNLKWLHTPHAVRTDSPEQNANANNEQQYANQQYAAQQRAAAQAPAAPQAPAPQQRAPMEPPIDFDDDIPF